MRERVSYEFEGWKADATYESNGLFSSTFPESESNITLGIQKTWELKTQSSKTVT